jgi:hypothetical protein
MPGGNEFFRSKLPIFVRRPQGIDNKAIYPALRKHQRCARTHLHPPPAFTPSLMHKVIHKLLVPEKGLKKPQLRREINVLH